MTAIQLRMREMESKNYFGKFREAFVHGDIFTKLSFFVWGLGYIGHGQLMKALIVTAVQALGLGFVAMVGAPNLAKFASLGTVKMEMVFDPVTMRNVVNNYDNSFAILLFSIIAIVILLTLLAGSAGVVVSNYRLELIRQTGKRSIPSARICAATSMRNFILPC